MVAARGGQGPGGSGGGDDRAAPRARTRRQGAQRHLGDRRIGAGGRAADDLKGLEHERIVALCDVDWKRAKTSFLRYPDAKQYKDFREMLDREKGIEAVLVATPDHTHAVIAMEAIRRGLPVYCEKPLTRTIHEARVLAKAARDAGVATQMGNQGTLPLPRARSGSGSRPA